MPDQYRYLAACYAHMRRLHEARAMIKRLQTITPHVMPLVMTSRKAEDRELLLSGLRLASGEATSPRPIIRHG